MPSSETIKARLESGVQALGVCIQEAQILKIDPSDVGWEESDIDIIDKYLDNMEESREKLSFLLTRLAEIERIRATDPALVLARFLTDFEAEAKRLSAAQEEKAERMAAAQEETAARMAAAQEGIARHLAAVQEAVIQSMEIAQESIKDESSAQVFIELAGRARGTGSASEPDATADFASEQLLAQPEEPGPAAPPESPGFWDKS